LRYPFLALACACVFGCANAWATTVTFVSSEEQVASARAIVLGRCTQIESRKLRGEIYTYITLDVREVLKGDVRPGTRVIRQAGGEVGDEGSFISGSPRFDVGRDSLVFLAANGDGGFVVDGLFLGNYFVETNGAGETWLVRDTGGEGVLVVRDPRKLGQQLDSLDRVELGELRRLAALDVRRTAKRSGALEAAPAQIPDEYRNFEGPSQHLPAFTFLNNQRWFEPDSGQTVPFYLNPNNFYPGIDNPPSLEAALVDSLAAWSTIPNCSLRLAYQGVDDTGCGWGPVDGVSRLSIDCRGEVTGEGCRGVIAIGGGHYTVRETVVVNGVTFRRTTEADVALQDGWCDYFQDPVALREVMTHELGHCIGLNHSTDTTSNLSPYIHNDRGGATLQQDDMDGARFLYPANDDGGGDGGGDDGGGGVDPEPEPPTIATTNLLDARIDEAYAVDFSVTHGKEPFVWDIAGGSLAPNMSLSASGELRGTPSQAGTYTFAVRVTDALGRVDGKVLSLYVRPPLPIVVGAAYKGATKTLLLAGVHFDTIAQFEINGEFVFPKKTPRFDAATSTFFVKGSRKKLNIQKGAGTNTVVVVVNGERSAPFTF
jgi:hypothetical protein